MNIDHIARHNLEPEDVEEALLDPDGISAPAYNAGSERRYGFIGATEAGRVLYVVYRRCESEAEVQTMKHTTRPDKTEDGFTIVHDPADLPEFASEADEVAYWDTHTWSEKLLEQAASTPRDPKLLPPRDRAKVQSRPTSLRLEASTTARLKRLAEKKGLAYQTLLKQFVLERLYEEEKREGLR